MFTFESTEEKKMDYKNYSMPTNKRARGIDEMHQDMIDLSEDELIALDKEWNEVEEYNKTVYMHNRKLEDETTEQFYKLFKDVFNVDANKYSGGHSYNKKIGTYAWFKNIKKEIKHTLSPYTHPSKPRFSKFTYNDIEIGINNQRTLLDKVNYIKSRIESMKSQARKQNSTLRKALVLCDKHGIDFDNLSDEEVIAQVTSLEEEIFVKENYPDGTEMGAPGCDECDTWIVGDNRCSCGNRRMSIIVDGDLKDGFYAYPEAW